MGTFTKHIENIKEYYPNGDLILITGNIVTKEGEDIIDAKIEEAVNYIQTILAVGDRVTNFKVGDTVDIDFNSMGNIMSYGVVLNGDPEVFYMLIPSRFIKGKVVLGEPILETVENITIDNE